MAEAKTKKAKYSVVMKQNGGQYHSIIVPIGGNSVLWRSGYDYNPEANKKLATEMAKALGTKVIDQT